MRYGKRSRGGKILMPLDTYAFERYGWLEDKARESASLAPGVRPPDHHEAGYYSPQSSRGKPPKS
jgi:hypothetical protein